MVVGVSIRGRANEMGGARDDRMRGRASEMGDVRDARIR